MIRKTVKWGLIVTGVVAVSGILVFGTDAFSYLKSSVHRVREAATDSVPLEFELARARDLIDEIVPEMQANVTLIAREEVEIEQLEQDITRSEQALADQRTRLAKLQNMVQSSRTHFTIRNAVYSRDDVMEDLSRSFERTKEAEVVLEGKRRLLTTRRQNLGAAITVLDKTRHRKALLADRVAGLEGQLRLVQAASTEGPVAVDGSKLAQADKLMRQIKKRLDVAERVLARRAQFVEIPVTATVDEADLLAELDSYLNPKPVEAAATEVAPKAPETASGVLADRNDG